MPTKPQIFQKPPRFATAWLRAIAAARKQPKGPLQIPRLQMELTPQPLDVQKLKKYQDLCGFAPSQTLPATWPQVVSGVLHIQMLTAPDFPLPAMGVVHLRNRIEVLRDITLDDPLHYTCFFEPPRLTAKGDEIDLVTEARVNGELAWRAVITILSRARKTKEVPVTTTEKPPETEPTEPLRSLVLPIAEDLGRRYARVAGDFNPIHQHALLARPFGFKRAIIHGMWSLARCVAELQKELPPPPFAIDVAFKRPVFLPSHVVLQVAKSANALHFSILSRDHTVTHLSGAVRPLQK